MIVKIAKDNKGEITTTVLMWGAGVIITTIVGLSSYFVSEKNSLGREVNIIKNESSRIVERTAVTETNIKNMDDRLTRIESKIDALLNKQGVIYYDQAKK